MTLVFLKTNWRRALIIPCLFLFLNGCTTFKPQADGMTDGLHRMLPDTFDMYPVPSDDANVPDQWWEAFNAAELNRLVEEALSSNFDIRTAWARLGQARAAAKIAGSGKSPSLDLSGGADQTAARNQGPGRSDTTDLSMGAAAAYEVDLWGRLSAMESASLLDYMATRQDLEAIAVSSAAAVTETWVNLLSIRQQIHILDDQIDTSHRLLDLQYLRFSNGRANALDVSRQKENLAATKAEMPGLLRQEQELKNTLGFLLGRTSAQQISLESRQLPDLIPLPDTGLPIDIIAARPDVRSAGFRLNAQNWTVAAAKADRLPRLTLTAQGLFSGGSLDAVFSNWMATLSASLAGPVFDGGRRSAEVEREKAVALERIAEYSRVVASAVKEVATALGREIRQREYLTLLNDQLTAARLAQKDAAIQYSNGQGDYLSFLIARASVQSLELAMVRAQADQIINRVSLYRSLGADWPAGLTRDGSPDTIP